MKTTTRILSLVIVLMMCASSLASAEPTEAELLAEKITNLVLPTPELPLTDVPVTLSLLFPKQSGHGDFSDMFYLKALEQKTGIRLEVQGVESQGWSEKLALSIASGDYGEIFLSGISFSDAANWGQAGILLPLEDLLEKYSPNCMTIFTTIPETKRNLTASDGHIYMMPAYDSTPRDMLMNNTYATTINKVWLDKVGLEAPSTLEGFYEMLKAFKSEDLNGNGLADEIPMSYVYDGNGFDMIIGAFGFVNLRHDIIDGKYVYVPIQEKFRYYLEFMNKLYTEGLLDADVFTQKTEDYHAKALEMKVGFMNGITGDLIGEDAYLNCTFLKPLASEYNDYTPVHPGRAQEVDKYGLCITNKATEEEAVLAVKLLDYLYSQEGTYLTKCGPEYGAWGDMIDGGYELVENADGTHSYNLIYDKEKYNNSYWNFRLTNGLMTVPFFCTAKHVEVIVGANVINNWTTEKVMESSMLAARRVGYPQLVTFTEDEQDTLAPFVLLDSYVDQMAAKFITGATELNDENWNKYLDTINMMDVSTLIDVRQAAYDRWNK